MIKPVVLPRVFYRHDILYVLNDAYYGSVAAYVGADRADVRIAYVVTCVALFYVVPQIVYCLRELFHAVHVLTQQMKHQPERCFAAYAGQL